MFVVEFRQRNGVNFSENYATEAEAQEAIETAYSVGIFAKLRK